jgi:predicted ATPase
MRMRSADLSPTTSSTPAQPASSIRLFILGSFCLERGGATIHLPTRKAESLLAYLALHPQPHAREKVAALFWGDSPDDLARRSLRTALASLRKEIGDEVVLADREIVQFNSSDHVWVDAIEFQAQAAQLLARDSPDAAIIDFDLYRGELLADFYDEWILAERERLHTLYLDALLRTIQRLREQSEYSRAIDTARKMLAVDVANEQAHQQVMFCHWSLGDRNAALKQFDECKRALHDELGVEPSPDTLALYERIKQASLAGSSPATANTNLPIPLTSFVGREREIETVKQVLGTTRLLTLTGVGGCGKTRLAIQVAREVVDEFADGVWWVELAAVREDERVLQLVVKALGLSDTGQLSPLDLLLNYLQARRALLVIDNCEHLVQACATLAETILSRCPHVRMLTTSREALNISGEIAWLVPSLSLPADGDLSVPSQLSQSESVRLFVERAQAIRHDFALTPANAAAVAHVCQRLDGIPLAIELAAARLKALTVEQINARLEDRFGLLTTGSRTALPRQQTLRATIDWSYELLSSAEQTLLRRLSVFSGGWTLEAAEAVCAGGEVERTQVLDLLTHIANKSLLIVMPYEGETRFSMLETVREYARDKLIEAGEFERTSDQHLRFFSKLAQADGMRVRGEGQLIAYRRLDSEYANLRVAFTWGLREDSNHVERSLESLRIATSLWQFWNMRGDYLEGHGWLQDAISRIDALSMTVSGNSIGINAGIVPDLQSLKAIALFGQGILTWFRSDVNEGTELFQKSAALAREAGDVSTLTYARAWIAYQTWDKSRGNLPAVLAVWEACRLYFESIGDEWGIAWVVAFTGLSYRMVGEYAKSRPFAQRSGDIRRKLGDQWGWSINSYQLAMISGLEGDYLSARAFLEPCLELAQEYGFTWQFVLALRGLGSVEILEGDLEQASVIFKQGLVVCHQAGMTRAYAPFFSGLARVFVAMGKARRATHLFSAARALTLSEIAQRPEFKDMPDEQTLLNRLRAEMGEAAFAAAWAEGQAMTLEQAVEEAMRV